MSIIATPITELFKIKHPIFLAGMNVAADPEFAAAVTNAGGLGFIGGRGYIPQSSGVTGIIIEEKTAVFVIAVCVPPTWVVDILHKARIPVMNIIGHPKHVAKALAVGVDLICAQAGEGGGHTGDMPASILIPAVVDAVKGHKSPLTRGPVYVIGAGGVYDGRGLAANLAWGAQAVWVGTRFVASTEVGASKSHKEAILKAGKHDDSARTTIYAGRPLRVIQTPYVDDWINNQSAEIEELTSQGIIPVGKNLKDHPENHIKSIPWLTGRVASRIHNVLPAKQIG